MELFTIVIILLLVWLVRVLSSPTLHKDIEKVGRSWKSALLLDNPVSDLVERGYRKVSDDTFCECLLETW